MQKLVVGGMVLLLGMLAWHDSGLGEQVSAPQRELRIVDRHSFNWASIVMNIFEHLIELDKDGKLVPGLATHWQWLNNRTLEVTLRQGVQFHNGEVFDAEIVKLNWQENLRLRQPFASGEFMNFHPESRLEILDPHTVRFFFPEPDGAALVKLAALHIGNRQFHTQLGWGEKHW